MNIMQKFNLRRNLNILSKIFGKNFSQKYDGIKGDVNWVDGQFVDGRPNIRRHNHTLPKKNYGKINLTSSDFSEVLKELKNPIYLSYNRRKRGAEKREDLLLEQK